MKETAINQVKTPVKRGANKYWRSADEDKSIINRVNAKKDQPSKPGKGKSC